MIFVDSGVWIDFYRDVPTPQTERLALAVQDRGVIVGDLVMVEVLQGLRSEREAVIVEDDLRSFHVVEVAGHDIAVQAARNYRLLRARGVTVRSTIETLIATRCIVEGWSLLHRDRDYLPFIAHLGLTPAIRMS